MVKTQLYKTKSAPEIQKAADTELAPLTTTITGGGATRRWGSKVLPTSVPNAQVTHLQITPP